MLQQAAINNNNPTKNELLAGIENKKQDLLRNTTTSNDARLNDSLFLQKLETAKNLILHAPGKRLNEMVNSAIKAEDKAKTWAKNLKLASIITGASALAVAGVMAYVGVKMRTDIDGNLPAFLICELAPFTLAEFVLGAGSIATAAVSCLKAEKAEYNAKVKAALHFAANHLPPGNIVDFKDFVNGHYRNGSDGSNKTPDDGTGSQQLVAIRVLPSAK